MEAPHPQQLSSGRLEPGAAGARGAEFSCSLSSVGAVCARVLDELSTGGVSEVAFQFSFPQRELWGLV